MSVELGVSYLCNDGIIRKAVWLSKRGFLHLQWYSEKLDKWFSGGRLRTEQFLEIIERKI